MAERKVLNKYYPPDFDPSKIRRFEKKSVRRMCNVRMMLPMSVRCKTCGNYMYLGTKFNMKVETVKDEDYLGIKIYRFYFKCTQCYSEVTFRTDPKNHDYIAEWGASRNHEPWKDMLMAEEEYKEMKQNEMKEDAMKSLEHRTYDSKREMDILDALDQVKSLNRRQSSINYQEMIDKVIHKENEKIEDDMEREIANIARNIYERVKIKRIRDFNENKFNGDNGNLNDNNNDNDNYNDNNENINFDDNIENREFNSNNNNDNSLNINLIKKNSFDIEDNVNKKNDKDQDFNFNKILNIKIKRNDNNDYEENESFSKNKIQKSRKFQEEKNDDEEFSEDSTSKDLNLKSKNFNYIGEVKSKLLISKRKLNDDSDVIQVNSKKHLNTTSNTKININNIKNINNINKLHGLNSINKKELHNNKKKSFGLSSLLLNYSEEA
jgi:hypothetical protein